MTKKSLNDVSDEELIHEMRKRMESDRTPPYEELTRAQKTALRKEIVVNDEISLEKALSGG